MPVLGMFGGAAPRLPRREPAPQFDPNDEEMFQTWYRARTAKAGLDPNPDAPEHKYDYRKAYIAGAAPDQTGHWPSEFKAPDHPNRFVDGMDTITGDPAPAVAQQQPNSGVPPLGMMMRGPEKPKPKQGGGLAEMFGYKGEDSGMGAAEWWFSPPSRRDAAEKQVSARAAMEQQREQMNAQIQTLQQSGYTPDQIIAFMNNPEKWSESLATNLEARNIAGGDSAWINGGMVTADKYGMDGGYAYRQGPNGFDVQGRRGQSYGEENDQATLAETARNNDLTNKRGWADINVDRSRLALDRDKAAKEALPDFGDENSFRNQYLGQAKPYQDVKAAAGRVKTLSADMNPAEQMALVFSTMKMLDPGSTVREGEYATAQNTTGIAGQAWNYYNKMQNGEFLNPTQINEFRTMIGGLEKEAEKQYVQTLDQYRGMAPRYRMDPSIIQDFRGPEAAPTPREQAAMQAREAQIRAGHAGGLTGGQGEFDPAAFANLRPSNDVSDLLDKYK